MNSDRKSLSTPTSRSLRCGRDGRRSLPKAGRRRTAQPESARWDPDFACMPRRKRVRREHKRTARFHGQRSRDSYDHHAYRGMKDTPEFIECCRRIGRDKALLAIRTGRTTAAAKAVSSHTGSMMQEDSLTDTIFEHAGVMRFDTTEEMISAA